MALENLDHYTVRTPIAELETTREFYISALGLTEGERPPFTFPGHWLYCGDAARVHLVGAESRGGPQPSDQGTGKLDHIAFRATGLAEMRERLVQLDVPFDERTVPLLGLHQLFVRDPNGIKIELNYPADEA